MTEDQIKHMANRFLGWPLPENFHPDGGISYEPVGNKGTPHEFKRQPSGTNLWGWGEAVAMARHMVEDLPKADDEVIWATSTTGEDFQCVHVDAWREAKMRVAELEAAIIKMQRAVPGGTIARPQEIADDLREIAASVGVDVDRET